MISIVLSIGDRELFRRKEFVVSSAKSNYHLMNNDNNNDNVRDSSRDRPAGRPNERTNERTNEQKTDTGRPVS